MNNIKIVIIVSLALTVTTLSDAFAQGRQVYPNMQDERSVTINPGERYNCQDCKAISIYAI